MPDFIVDGMHISMAGRKLTGHDLISSAMALEIARVVLKYDESEEQLTRQEPLQVSEAEGVWIVLGNAPAAVSRAYPSDQTERGQFEIHIAKFDGRITRIGFNISFPEASEFMRRRQAGLPVDDLISGESGPKTLDETK